MRRPLEKLLDGLLLVGLALALIVALGWFTRLQEDCDARGGVLVRGALAPVCVEPKRGA